LKIKKFDCEGLNILANEALLAIRNARSYYRLYKDYQSILEAMGEELSIIDMNYNILYMNREKAIRIGNDYSDKNKKCYNVFARRNTPCPSCPCIDAIETGEIIRRSDYHVECRRDGKEHYVTQTASPLKDIDGHCSRAVKVVRDGTKQKKLFDIIENLQQESNLDQLISIIMDGISELGYKRARFYDYTRRENGNEFVIGRVSRGMGNFQKKFKGFRINLEEAVYLEPTLNKKEPRFYYGDICEPTLKGRKWIKDLELENVKWMDLPLMSGKELIGVIAIDNKSKGDEFTNEDLNIMAILAYYASQAIENSRYISRQKILYDVSNELSRTLNIGELQRNIVKNICKALNTEMCSILLFDEKRNLLIRKATCLNTKRGWTHNIDFEEKYEVDTYICGKVYKKGNPKIINDIPHYRPRNEFFINKYEELLLSNRVKNAIFAPLTYMGDKIGIIRASNKLTGNDRLSEIGFKQEDLDLLVSLGEQIAIALANSKLYENQKRSIKQLELLTDISNFVQKEIDLSKKLYLILTGLTIHGGMDFNRTILFLADKKKTKLKGEIALSPANEQKTLNNWGELFQRNIKKDNQQLLIYVSENYDQNKEEILESELNKKCKGLTFKSNDKNVLTEAFKEKNTLHSAKRQFKSNDSFLKDMVPGIWAITPLIVDEDPIGVIYADNQYYNHKITDQQIEILKLFANQAATVIHNSKLDEEKNLQLKGLETLNEVISMITSAADLEEIYRSIEETKNIFPNIDEMCLLIKEEAYYSPVIKCSKRGTPECENCKIQERQCIKKRNSYYPYYCPNIEKDPYFKKAIKKNLKSRFIIPLVFRMELLGIFDIGSKTPDAFSEFDRKLFRSLGSQIAIAVNNRVKQDKQIEIFKDISHSLGTYLTTMRGYTQRLIEGKVTDESKIQEYLKRLYGDVLTLINSIDEISSLATMEYGGMTVERSTVEINDILDSIARKNEFLLNERNLKLEISRGQEKAYVTGDNKKLEEALQSVMSNAIKFSEKNKTIQMSVLTKANYILIKIKDQGIGIHVDDLSKIFRKYERGRNAKERKIEGTGIGLATAKNIIERHSGEISVQSQLKKGSTFTIKLPVLL
jgi:signal transduction histidine kinase